MHDNNVTLRQTTVSPDSPSSILMAPSAQLNVAGNDNLASRVGTATSYTATGTEKFIGVTSTAAARTVTLPAPSAVGAGWSCIVKDESGAANTNNITVQGASGNIDGSANKAISTAYGVLRVYTDGTNYFTW